MEDFDCVSRFIAIGLRYFTSLTSVVAYYLKYGTFGKLDYLVAISLP